MWIPPKFTAGLLLILGGMILVASDNPLLATSMLCVGGLVGSTDQFSSEKNLLNTPYFFLSLVCIGCSLFTMMAHNQSWQVKLSSAIIGSLMGFLIVWGLYGRIEKKINEDIKKKKEEMENKVVEQV